MQRNAPAIALKIYLLIAVGPVAFRALPLPGTLERTTGFYGMATIWLIISGCLVALIGELWLDRLDGSVIEQFGLVMASIGFILYACALLRVLPLNHGVWLPMIMCGGFAVAFGTQWFLIYRWRRPLHLKVRGDGQ